MPSFFNCEDGEFGMFGVWRRYIHGIAHRQHLSDAMGYGRASCPRELFGERLFKIVNRSDLAALIAGENRRVHSRDVARAEESDLDFGHRLEKGSVPSA